MSMQLIIGRSGSGKSRYCLDAVRGKLRENPDGSPLVLLVPEQATFQAEYSLAQTPDLQGMIRAQALSFRRLAFRVMQETGGTALIHIDDNGKSMLLYKILHKRKQELRLFSRAAEQFGFVGKLNELHNEMKRYCVSPQSLFPEDSGPQAGAGYSSAMMADKLHDLQLIYEDFEAELSKLYVDSEDYLAMLAEGIPNSSYIKELEVWIDGFHGFTPQEYRVIEQLLQHARKVSIALCLDREYVAGERPHELSMFHPTASTCIQLSEMAEQLGVVREPAVVLDDDPLPRYAASRQLAHLERNYERRIRWVNAMDEAGNGISLHAAVNRRAEVEGAAREMIRLVRDNGYRWRDMAILVRNTAAYEDYLTTIFADYGIPYFLDQKRTVLHHPLAEFIRSSLETVALGWRYDAVFRCVKTEFLLPLDGSVNRSDIDRLENYALARGIDGWRWTDARCWRPLRRDGLEQEELTAVSGERTVEMEGIMRSRDFVVEPLQRMEREMKRAANVRDMTEALYRLLEAVQAPERLQRWSDESAAGGDPQRAREHNQLWDNVVDMLDQIVEMMGEEQLSLELFAGIVETGLASMKLGLVPPALDQVLVGSIDRTRSGNIRYCMIIGANDGVIPAQAKEDGVLTEQERERLADSGLTLAPGIRRKLLDEKFILYNALTTPSDHLWISYALADEEGKTLLPSELLRHMKAMYPGLKEQMLLGEPGAEQSAEEQFAFVAHPERVLSHLIVQLREWRRGVEISPFWWELFNWYCGRPEWQTKLQLLTQSLFYSNNEPPLSVEASRALFGRHLRASVSRMERFVACPFAHFASHGLRLEERAVYRLEAPDIGELFHAALSRIAAGLAREGISWGELSAEQCRVSADAVVDELAPRLQGEILLSSKRYGYIARKLKDIVGRASAVLGEHSRRSAFVPVGLELAFGPDKPIPSLQFTLPNGCTMEIIGRIDRIDAAEDDNGGLLVRIIDYKSSETHLKLDEVYYGLSLQTLTYLDIAVSHAEQWLGRSAAPAGALYFHVHNPLIASGNALAPEQAQDELLKRFKMRGLVRADKETVKLMDATADTGYSQLIPVRVKKDGGFDARSSVATPEQWETLRGAVRRTIRRIGTRITDGEVAIAPYRIGKKTACQHCAYKPVCQFDPLIEGNAYGTWLKPGKEQVWQLLSESEGTGGHELGTGIGHGKTAEGR